MEEDKENARIPLPQLPLSPIPKVLIGEYKNQTKTMVQRLPLGTLNGQSEAGSSKVKYRIISSTPLKPDTISTIVRRGDKCLNRDFEVFKEQSGIVEACPIYTYETDFFNDAICEENSHEISSEEPTNTRYFSVKRDDQCLDWDLEVSVDQEPTGSVKTPANKTSTAEPGNLKIQGRNENLYILNPISWQFPVEPENFDYLLKSENKASPTQFIHKKARACIVNWLMTVNGPEGHPAVLQTACWYFDAILARKAIPKPELRIKASSCLWIANKLYQKPAATSTTLAKLCKNGFLESQLLDAEKEVLLLLGFPRQPVVPQDFISFFSWTCDKELHDLIEMSATFFAMCGLLFHKNYCCEYPSVVAAAAVKNACIGFEIMSDFKAKLESCPRYKKAAAKAINFERTCSAQRVAARTVALPFFQYNAPYRNYGQPPLQLAQIMVKACAKLMAVDVSTLPSSWLHLL